MVIGRAFDRHSVAEAYRDSRALNGLLLIDHGIAVKRLVSLCQALIGQR